VAATRHAHVARQQDDRGAIIRTPSSPDRFTVDMLDDYGFLVHHEHESSLERHDGERFVARIEHQSAHSSSSRTAGTASR
jgi:hypothetical protein